MGLLTKIEEKFEGKNKNPLREQEQSGQQGQLCMHARFSAQIASFQQDLSRVLKRSFFRYSFRYQSLVIERCVADSATPHSAQLANCRCIACTVATYNTAS